MTNLFSSFDPASLLGMPLNWASTLCVLMFLPSKFWMASNQPLISMTVVVNMVKSEFKASLSSNSVPGVLLISLSLLIMILINNYPGLWPYVFTSSSHLTFTVALALPLWVGHMILASLKTPTLVLAHLVPLGTPAGLIPFMTLIEVISSVIRPLTLSVRLAANMMAGHLLLSLLSGPSYNLNTLALIAVLGGLVLMGVLETAVSLIQAYVFSVLSTLYLNEVNSNSIA